LNLENRLRDPKISRATAEDIQFELELVIKNVKTV
jgi:hypothetical protein